MAKQDTRINKAPTIDHGNVDWDRAPATTTKRKADASAAKTRHAQKVADLSGSEILKSVRRAPAAKRLGCDLALSEGKLALAAAKRADPAPKGKRQVAGPLKKADTITQHGVANLGQLRAIIDTFPHGAKFDTDRKFGIPIFRVLNLRGRPVAEIKLLTKPVK